MPNHYSDIGLDVNSLDDLNKIISQIAPNGKIVKNGFCRYWMISVDTHIEFWQHIKFNNKYNSFEMYYEGKSLIPVRFDNWVTHSNDFSEGSAYLWYHRDGDLFPFVIDVVNSGFYKKLKQGDKLFAGVSCFAESLEVYDNDSEYYNSQVKEIKFAPEFFIPTGTFNPDGSEKEPVANAWFGGHILSFEKCVNSVCGKEYYHFAISCQDAVFDILASCELVTQDPVIGGVLNTSCWMSGKLKKN